MIALVHLLASKLLLQAMLETNGQRLSLHLSDTPRGSWASSIFDLKNSQADPLLPTLLERTSQDRVDADNESQRHLHRHDAVYSLYPDQLEVGNVSSTDDINGKYRSYVMLM